MLYKSIFQAYFIGCVWSCYKILVNFRVKQVTSAFLFHVHPDENEVHVVQYNEVVILWLFDYMMICLAKIYSDSNTLFLQTQNLLPNYEDAVKDTPKESPPPYTSN